MEANLSREKLYLTCIVRLLLGDQRRETSTNLFYAVNTRGEDVDARKIVPTRRRDFNVARCESGAFNRNGFIGYGRVL